MFNLKKIEEMSWNKVIDRKLFDEMTKDEPNKEAYEKILTQAKFKFSDDVKQFDLNSISKMSSNEKFNEEAVYNVPECYLLQPNKKYKVLKPLEEYQLIIDIKCGEYARNLLNECDSEALEQLGIKDVLDNKVFSNERVVEKVLLSFIPLIVKKISDYFKIRLNEINNLNDYISDCLLKVKEKINMYDIRIGGELKRYLWLPLTAQIRETYGNIGGNFRLNPNQVIERTEIYNILQEDPYLSCDELAKKMGFTVGSKPYYNFLQRLDMYKMWRSDAEEACKENDYYAKSGDYFNCSNDVDTQIEVQEKDNNLKVILNYVKNNFSERNYEMFVDYYDLQNKYDVSPTYDTVAKNFNTTRQNAFGIIKNILSAIREATKKGVINVVF